MDPRAGWELRWVRALGLTIVALLLAMAAHWTAGGLIPDARAVAAMLAVGSIANAAWLGREASYLRVITLLVVGQTVLHGAMTAVAGHVGEPAEPLSHGVSAVARHTTEHLLGELTPANAPMALAHLMAAVGTGIWLALGERALWNLVLLVVGMFALLRLAHAVPAAPVVVRRPRPAPLLRVPRPGRELLRTTVVRRGPPLLHGA